MLLDPSRSVVRDDQIAMRQHRQLWNVSLDVDVGGLSAELRRIDLGPHRDDEVDG